MSRIHDQLSESAGAQPPRPPVAVPPRPPVTAPPPRPVEPAPVRPPEPLRQAAPVQHPGQQRTRSSRPMLRKSTELKSPPIGGLKAIAAFWIACGILMASITHHILTDRPDDKPHSAAKKKSVAHRQPVAVRPEVVPVPAPAPEPAPAARPVVAIIDLPKEPAAIAPHAPPRELQLPLIEMPGTRTMEDKDGFSIVFDYGAFSRVDQLRAEARNTLAELAERIRPQMDRVSVVVTGFTDNDPVPANRPYKSNVELGMMRAVAASKVLIEAGLPSDKVATRSLGDHETPYPNDTADNKARNRTVVVSIRRQP